MSATIQALFNTKAAPVQRIPTPHIAQKGDLLPRYLSTAVRLTKQTAPWGAAWGIIAVWFTYPAWREGFKDRVIPGYAAYHGHEIVEEKKK